MAKLMSVTVHVEEAAFGRIVTMLNGAPGVIKMDLHLGDQKKQKRQKLPVVQKQGPGVSNQPLVLAALAERPLSKKQIEEVLSEAGVKVGSSTAYGVIHQLKKKKLLVNGKANDEGDKAYALTAAGKRVVASASAEA